jgi:hypothetical protein
MEELMTAVFVAHTKVLTAVRLSTKLKKLSITVPKLDHFLHRIFKESARCFWKSPFLFMSEGGVVERQKNILQVEALASEAITTAIRGLLPVKQILQDYLGEDEEDISDAPASASAEAEEQEKPESEVKPVEEVKEVKEVNAEPEKLEKPEAEAEAEVKEVTPVAEVKEEAEVKEKAEVKAPSVIKIDTEPAVHFSDYDAVFDEAKGAPEMRFNPKDEDGDEIPSDALTIHDGPDTPLTADDAEDLDAPKPVPKPVAVAVKDTIDDSDVVVLE